MRKFINPQLNTYIQHTRHKTQEKYILQKTQEPSSELKFPTNNFCDIKRKYFHSKKRERLSSSPAESEKYKEIKEK